MSKWVLWREWAKTRFSSQQGDCCGFSLQPERGKWGAHPHSQAKEKEVWGRDIGGNSTYLKRERLASYSPANQCLPCWAKREGDSWESWTCFLELGVYASRDCGLLLSRRILNSGGWLEEQFTVGAREGGPTQGLCVPTISNGKDARNGGLAKQFGSTHLIGQPPEVRGPITRRLWVFHRRISEGLPQSLLMYLWRPLWAYQQLTRVSPRGVPALGDQSHRRGTWLTTAPSYCKVCPISSISFVLPLSWRRGEKEWGRRSRDGAGCVSLPHCRTLSWSWGAALHWM